MTPRPLLKAVFCALPLLTALSLRADFTSLNMGLEYGLRAVSIDDRDGLEQTKDSLGYYSQVARLYMRSWLNEDVEASFRLQSVNVWGMEGAGPLTRYPNADGTPWVEEAYIHLPHFARKKIDLTVGRQPIVVGDGLLVSDDQLGFNGVRARANLPWKLDVDLFTAKIAEGLGGQEDFDLYGLVLGTDQEHNRWEFAWIEEVNHGDSAYIYRGATVPASNVQRRFYGLRLHGNLKDAFYKAEVALQSGDARLPGGEITLEGIGQSLELGAQADTTRFGRFGVRALYAVGSGDDAGTANIDEAFRPTFSRRWDGLERTGRGAHFAATLSDAYAPATPFDPLATGLNGVSGIKTIGFGIFSVQKVFWTGALDYYAYESRAKRAGLNELGSEIDAKMTYQYTGFVSFKAGASFFFPGEVFSNEASRVTHYTLETRVHF